MDNIVCIAAPSVSDVIADVRKVNDKKCEAIFIHWRRVHQIQSGRMLLNLGGKKSIYNVINRFGVKITNFFLQPPSLCTCINGSIHKSQGNSEKHIEIMMAIELGGSPVDQEFTRQLSRMK